MQPVGAAAALQPVGAAAARRRAVAQRGPAQRARPRRVSLEEGSWPLPRGADWYSTHWGRTTPLEGNPWEMTVRGQPSRTQPQDQRT